MEWKWNGNGMEKKTEMKWKKKSLEWNGIGMEMEWKIFDRKKNVIWNGKWNGMEWKYNGKKYDKSRGKINRWHGMEMERK